MDWHHDNGILERIGGQHVAQALQTLPPAQSSTAETIEAELEVPGIGRVRFTMRRCKSRKGKSSHYYWSTTKAILME
jgi:hypothetical protein